MSRTAVPAAPGHRATPGARVTITLGPMLSLALILTLALAGTADAKPQDQATSPDRGTENAGKSGAADTRPFVEMRKNARERRATRAAGDLSPTERVATIVENAWWNDQDLAESLHLTQSQRHQMDDTLRNNLTTRREALDTSAEAQRAFYEELEAGNPKAAATHLDTVGAAHAAVLHSQLQLRIAVAEILTPDQRKALGEARPRLWRQSWIRLPSRPAPATRARGAAKRQNGSGG